MTINVLRKAVRLATVGALLLSTTACVTTTKVATEQPGDEQMSCVQLAAEFKRLDTVMAEGDENKGVNAANVAAVLIFPLAAVGNYMDADKAQRLVELRRAHLMSIYRGKSCS